MIPVLNKTKQLQPNCGMLLFRKCLTPVSLHRHTTYKHRQTVEPDAITSTCTRRSTLTLAIQVLAHLAPSQLLRSAIYDPDRVVVAPCFFVVVGVYMCFVFCVANLFRPLPQCAAAATSHPGKPNTHADRELLEPSVSSNHSERIRCRIEAQLQFITFGALRVLAFSFIRRSDPIWIATDVDRRNLNLQLGSFPKIPA